MNLIQELPETPLEFIHALSVIQRQVVSIDLGTEMLLSQGPEHRTKRFITWLIDDEDSLLGQAIQTIQQLPLPFTVFVNLFNSKGEVCEHFAFKGCSLDALQHSLLSYEEPSKENPNCAYSMKLLQFGFDSHEHNFLNVVPMKLSV